MTGRFLLVPLVLLSLSACSHRAAQTAQRRGDRLPTAMHRQVMNAVDAGDGDVETRTLRAQMTAHPEDPKARVALAQRYNERGYPEIAVEHCRLAAERFPNSQEVQEMLVRSLRGMGMRKAASESLEKYLVSAQPTTSRPYSLLGILYDEMRQFATAEAWHRKALGIDTQSDLLHNNLGYNMLLQGRKDEAVAEFRAALKLNSRSQVARNNLGVAVASQPGEAISTWQSISDPATAHNNMAAVLMEQKRYQEARQELEIALGYRRDHPAALSNLSLLSESDKTPLTLPGKENHSRWKRFGHGMYRAFVGEQVKKQSGPIESASR